VVSYAQPRRLGEEGEPPRKKRKGLGSLSLPASPPPSSPVPCSSTPSCSRARSTPPSPQSAAPAFATSLLERAQGKADTKRVNKRKEMKEQKRRLIGEKLEEGMSRAKVLEEVMVLETEKKTSKKIKKLKHLIRDCDQGRVARREMREAEFQERRGFRSSQEVPRVGKARRKEALLALGKGRKGEVGSKEEGRRRKGEGGSREEGKVTRAALIPTDVSAAWKFLKKETQKVTADSSDLSKRLKKDLKQEIFGLKHNLHQAPRLKKVERKRLADLVINLRNHA